MFGKKKTKLPYENSRFYETGDYKLHYRVDEARGEKKGKFFIVHGFWLNTAFYDELTEELTAAGYDVYRVDLADFGYSTRELPGINYVPSRDLVAEMLEALDEDGTGFILYGHSMGGSVVLEVAAAGSDHLNALILNAPMLMRDMTEEQGKMFTTPFMQKALSAEAWLITKLNYGVKLFIYLMTWDKEYSWNFDSTKFTAQFKEKNAGPALGYFTAMVRKPDVKTFKNISVPVQYIAGGKDLFVSGRLVRQLRRSLPKGSQFKKLKGAGHCFPENRAAEAAELAVNFLEN